MTMMDGDFRQLIRFFFLGPCLGAVIGILHLSAAILVWDYHDSLDSLYRNFDSLVLTYVALGTGGFMVGVPFGLVLLASEKRLGREIPVTRFVTWAWLVATFISLIESELVFSGIVENPFTVELCALVTSSAMAFGLSKRKPDATDALTVHDDTFATVRRSIE